MDGHKCIAHIKVNWLEESSRDNRAVTNKNQTPHSLRLSLLPARSTNIVTKVEIKKFQSILINNHKTLKTQPVQVIYSNEIVSWSENDYTAHPFFLNILLSSVYPFLWSKISQISHLSSQSHSSTHLDINLKSRLKSHILSSRQYYVSLPEQKLYTKHWQC